MRLAVMEEVSQSSTAYAITEDKLKKIDERIHSLLSKHRNVEFESDFQYLINLFNTCCPLYELQALSGAITIPENDYNFTDLEYNSRSKELSASRNKNSLEIETESFAWISAIHNYISKLHIQHLPIIESILNIKLHKLRLETSKSQLLNLFKSLILVHPFTFNPIMQSLASYWRLGNCKIIALS